MVLEKGAPNMKYGVLITFSDGESREKWYGSNQALRDRKHHWWSERRNVTVVQDIEKPK